MATDRERRGGLMRVGRADEANAMKQQLNME